MVQETLLRHGVTRYFRITHRMTLNLQSTCCQKKKTYKSTNSLGEQSEADLSKFYDKTVLHKTY